MHTDLLVVKDKVFDPCKLKLDALVMDKESKNYGGCSFQLNGLNVTFRVGKTTPTKVGQFVTIWKRDQKGFTQPFDSSDQIDVMIIGCRTDDHFGMFIFPKEILEVNGVIATKGMPGKRGFRVYPPWDRVGNRQAAKAQIWQTRYFLEIQPGRLTDLGFFKNVLIQYLQE